MPLHRLSGGWTVPVWLSALEWVLFSLYWKVASRGASEAKSSESRSSRRVHEVLVNAALVLMFFPVPGLSQRFLPDDASVAWFGLGVETAGLALSVWARRHLGQHWSGEITIKVDHQLIQSGPYRFVRHPIYTAILGMFLETAMVSGNVLAAIGLLIAICAYWRKIQLEEANLHRAFTPAYEAYGENTWALVPGLW